MTGPREALTAAGAQTTLIAPQQGKLQAMRHDVKAGSFDVDQVLEKANPADYDAAVLAGGAFNADALRTNQRAQEFIRRIDEAGKPIAVICHGSWLLVSAGLTRGRTLTSYYTIQDDIRNSGGEWVDREVVVDRNWVSSRQPSDLPAFWLNLDPEAGRLFFLSPASLSALGYEDNRSQPVMRLWNDTCHLGTSVSSQLDPHSKETA
jgi:protease I